MATSSLFLSGRITRRIFTVFLVFALVPVCVFSYFAITRLTEATEQQVRQVVENETRNLSYLILERLNLAEQLLSNYPVDQNNGLSRGRDMTSQPGKSALNRVRIMEPDRLQDVLSNVSRERLEAGSTVIVNAEVAGSPDATLMLRAIEPGIEHSRLAAISLSESRILGAPENRNQRIDSCVLDPDKRVLFASDSALCQHFLSSAPAVLGHKGELVFSVDGDYFSRYRSIFMGQHYGTPDWVVVVLQPRNDLFLASTDFRQNFLAIALGVILALSLASIYFIRTRMAPLASIMAGIERVSAKRYDQPVEVDSGDEFQELAEAFNDMSGQVSRQLHTMAYMAEIDQLILTRQGMENVIRVVLDRADSILPSEAVGLAIVDEKTNLDTNKQEEKQSCAGELYLPGEIQSAPMVAGKVSLNFGQCESLKSQPLWLDRTGEERRDALFQFFPETVEVLYLLPLKREGNLAGIIFLGYSQRPAQHDEIENLAGNFADRISVALGNAEWEERLFRQAHYDLLTGLPNRLSMMDRLNLSIKQAERSGHSFAVSFIDMDDFKLINDAMGHMVGDEMIEIIAGRLQQCMRAGDTVARMGGDEFVLISAAFQTNESATIAMSRIAEKILATIAEPLEIGGREVRSSSSIGVAIYPRDGRDVDTLLKNADTAMYSAKAQGRGRCQFFSEKLNEESVALMHLSSDIKGALESEEFELYYQPKVSMASGKLTGAEALIRWNHPTRGLVSPGEFIEVAERMGLISAIGDWTLHEACRQIKTWETMGFTPPRVAVNMSAIQIHKEDIAAKVQALLSQHQIKPESLELEIVEGALVEDLEATSEKLAAVRKLGVHISIDDYGTGYSSLRYVKVFPVDTLKLDRCFITNICSDQSDLAIVHSTIVLAHSMHLKVIAEGVETEEQLEELRRLNCDQIQGYYFSKPVAADQFARFLGEASPFIKRL